MADDTTGGALHLVAAKSLEPAEDIFLCDHAMSFEPGSAREQLAEHSPLRVRLGMMLLGRCGNFLAGDHGDLELFDDMDWLLRGLDGLSGKFSVPAGADGAPIVVHYVLDEIGSSFHPSPSPEHPDAAFLMTPFIDPATGQSFSIFFPRRAVGEWEAATCAGLPHARSRAAALTRVLLPPADTQLATVFRQALVNARFDCETVCSLLRVGHPVPAADAVADDTEGVYRYLPAWDLGPGSAANASAALRLDSLEHKQPRDAVLDLVRLFILGMPLASLDRVAAAVGGLDVAQFLVSSGILWQPAGAPLEGSAGNSVWASTLQIVPVPLGSTRDACLWVATDWPSAPATLQFCSDDEEPVMCKSWLAAGCRASFWWLQKTEMLP